MPSCRITNYTTQPLNVSLKHLCALHFENEVAPGQTVKLKPGRVWFTLEVLVDDKTNRYSMAQSAAAIAIVSLACVGSAALAVPAAAAVGGATAGGTITGAISAGVGHIVAADTITTGFGSAYAAAQGFLTAHAGTAAKVSAMLLPKAIEVVEKEVGGFTAVQKEVIAILSSPNIAKDVREEGLSILRRLGAAIAADRLAEEEEQKKREKEMKEIQDVPSSSSSKDGGETVKPGIKRVQTSVSALMNKLSSEARMERKAARRAATEPCLDTRTRSKSWSMLDFDASEAYGEQAGDNRMLSTQETLRIHGLFMSERRHFEVHEREGKLVLIDANTKETVKVG
ncbi:hypothetical protein CPB86DRAFT_805200 [Serendipita vermifera]|nr:hypothetical protein CPB86DRAFT_805200 [Serendipita vermifera]